MTDEEKRKSIIFCEDKNKNKIRFSSNNNTSSESVPICEWTFKKIDCSCEKCNGVGTERMIRKLWLTNIGREGAMEISIKKQNPFTIFAFQ